MWSAMIRGAVQYGRVGAAALVAFSVAGHNAGAGAVTSGAARCASSRPAKDLAPIRCDDGTLVIPWSCPPRETQLRRLREEIFDVLVIGGGCVGSGVAMDGATRGLNVALVERSDFAAGTSGRSTKLIHGGIRYLEAAFMKMDWDSYLLVDEALSERAFMMRSAPFMARPVPIMIPIYEYWKVPYMWAGAKVYDFVAGKARGLPPSYFMSKEEALFRFPMLKSDSLKGAVVYYDGQHNDTRMNLLIALTAAQKGAATANYVEVLRLTKDKEGKVNGADVIDRLTNEEYHITARSVVNATGPFADAVRKMDDPEAQDVIVPAAGTHVILPDHFSPSSMGLIIPETQDGRVLFFLPWEGSTICGTTDAVSDITMTPVATIEDIDFILQESNNVLKKVVQLKDVRAAWSGLRPLVKAEGADGSNGTAQISRQHRVIVSDSNLVSICGGKWTTYRKMAEDTIDKVLQVTPVHTSRQCATPSLQILGADRAGIVVGQKFDRIVVTLREEFLFDRLVASHLVSNYGTRALQVADIARKEKLDKQLVRTQPMIEAEVVFATRQEYAHTVIDVVARRTRLSFLDTNGAMKAIPRIAELMASELKWSRQKRKQEEEEAVEYVNLMRAQYIASGEAAPGK